MSQIKAGYTFASPHTSPSELNKAFNDAKIQPLVVTSAMLSCGAGALKKITMLTDAVTIVNITASGDVAWSDIDLTAHTSDTTSSVMISAYFKDSAAGTSNVSLAFRKNGSADAAAVRALVPLVNSRYAYGQFIVPCDAGQIIEYNVEASGANTANGRIYLLGYMEDF